MEIGNNKTGQDFAVTSALAGTKAVAVNDAAPNLVGIGEQDDAIVNDAAKVRKDSSDGSINENQIEENSSQAGVTPADNKAVERNEAALETAVQEVESFIQVQNRDLQFTIDEETKRSVVTVKDSQSGDVIRQIPSEEVLKLAERIQDLQQDVGASVGVFINNQV